MNKLWQLIKKNLTVLLNAGSIVGTTAVTSVLGFAYWWVAARLFSTNSIGLAEAMISMMSLLGTISMLGLGTLLTGELTRQPGKEWSLINTALIVSGGVGIIAGVAFAFLAPFLSPSLDSVGESIGSIAIFAVGVGLTALTMVLDQALIGILRGGLQLGRNMLFSIVKLGALIASFFLFQSTGMLIYVTWLMGNLVSLAVLLVQRSKKTKVENLGEIAVSGSLAISGPLGLTGPLSTIEKSIQLPCPICGTHSSNSASFCLKCGYPFSPTVEIASVRPQLLFDYGVIGVSDVPRPKKGQPTSGNACPDCGKTAPDEAAFCTFCGYPLTPTIEIPSVKFNPAQLDIEALSTIPLLTSVKRVSTPHQQALSAESTLLISSPARNAQMPAAIKQTPLPIDAEETLIANLPKTPLAVEQEVRPDVFDEKRSALFLEDEITMALPDLPSTPLADEIEHAQAPVVSEQGTSKSSFLPQWGMLRKLGKVAIQHHIVNLILMMPSMLLPILVTVLLSPTANAYFYVSFMLANFVFSLTYSLTTVLHAVSSAQPAILAQKIRFTLALSLVASVAANLVLQVGAGLLLSLFSHAYAEHAAWCLRILSLAVFPVIVKSHFIAICRVYDRTAYVIAPIAIGSALELALAAVGAHFGSLEGLSLGWFAALMLEALYMTPTVYKAANPVNVNIKGAKVA